MDTVFVFNLIQIIVKKSSYQLALHSKDAVADLHIFLHVLKIAGTPQQPGSARCASLPLPFFSHGL